MSVPRPVHRSSSGSRRGTLPRAAALALVVSPLAVVGVSPIVAGPTFASSSPPPAVTDVNPNSTPTPLWGGRVERLAIDPVNPSKVFAASELGGFWRSTDGGATWSHVDAMSMAQTSDVVIAEADSDLVIATGRYDGRQQSRGGIWRSTDGGATWAKPAGSDPACTTEPSAFNAAIGPGTPGSLPVFVATTCGLAISLDSGATWTHTDPATGFSNGLTGSRAMDDVIARAGSGGDIQVDVCGTQGFFRSNDTGATWSAPDPNSPTFRDADGAGPLGTAFGPCSLAVDPSDPNTVFLANFSNLTSAGLCQGQLLESNNAGAAGTWTPMGVTDAACADPFVQTRATADGDPTHYDVYFGTPVRLLRQTCDRDHVPNDCLPGAANWTRWDQNTPHTTPSHIAFNPPLATGCPSLVSGDFGVMRPTTNGCAVMPTFAMTNSGLHAFDASQLAGTVTPGAMQLYFGTAHNGIYSSTDGGATYSNRGPDVFNVLADRTMNPDAAVLWRPCFGCGLVRSTPGLVADIAWTNPPGADVANNFVATQFGPRSYAFATPDVAAGPGVDQVWTVYVTTNAGNNWTQFGSALPGDPVPSGDPVPGQHGALQATGSASNPTFYLNLKVPAGNRIYRLAGTLDTTQPTNNAALTQVSNGLNSPVNFAVDPTDPSRLYATDTGLQRMMRSTNGGASWIADNALTSLVTGNGVFKFDSTTLGEQATGIGFDPFSDTILVGTRTNGIFATVNNGQNWLRVRGSQVIPFALDFAFDNIRNQAYVGSRGRGVWRIDIPSADLSLTKTSSPDPATAGGQLTYTLTVTNTGPQTASNITVTDTLPGDTHYVTSSIPCTTAPAPTGDVVTCELPDLASGGSATFTVTAQIEPDAVSDNGGPLTLENTATVSSGETLDPNRGNNTDTETTVVNDLADLAVAKICDPRESRAGETIHCTVFVDNQGPSDARGVVITDRILSGGTFTVSNVNGGPGSVCTPVTSVPGGRQFECNVGVVRAATTSQVGRKTLTYDISATEGQQLDNLAKARSDTPDPDDTNNAAQETLAIQSVADLSLVKNGPASATAGSSYDYTLTAFNNGPSTAQNVVITDTLPAGLTINSVAAIGASCHAGVPGDPAQPTTCTFASLAPGATTPTMTVSVTVAQGTSGLLHNAARVASETLDPSNSNNLDNVGTNVAASADLAVAKAGTPSPVVAGTPMTYTIGVDNGGPSLAEDVVLVDDLPGNFTFSSATIEHGSGTCVMVEGSPNTVECQLGDLASADYVVVHLNGVVKSGTPHGSSLANSVTVQSATADPASGNNTAATSTPVNAVADLSTTLTTDKAVYKPSTTIHYTLTVTNAGPSDAANVVVTQQLPPSKFGYYVSNDAGCTVAGTLLTCPTISSLAAGTSFVTVVNWFVQGQKGTITSTANATSSTTDPVAGNNSATKSVLRK